MAVLSLTTLKPQPCLLVFHSGSLLPFPLVLEKLGLSSPGLFLHSASGTLGWPPRMLRQESSSHTAPVCPQSVFSVDCLGKLPLPFACINHSHRALKLSPCRPPMCQAPAALYCLVLIGHLPVVNPSPCLPKLSFLDLAFQPLRGFSPSAGSWISAPFPPLRSHWSLSASSPLFPAHLSIPICTS